MNLHHLLADNIPCPSGHQTFEKQKHRSAPLKNKVDLRSSLLTLGKVGANSTFLSLNRSLAQNWFFSPKGVVFATMKAEFWNKTVVGSGLCKSLLLGTRPEEQDVGPKATAIMSGVFQVFVLIFNGLKLPSSEGLGGGSTPLLGGGGGGSLPSLCLLDDVHGQLLTLSSLQELLHTVASTVVGALRHEHDAHAVNVVGHSERLC